MLNGRSKIGVKAGAKPSILRETEDEIANSFVQASKRGFGLSKS
jgi:hypothetical protein